MDHQSSHSQIPPEVTQNHDVLPVLAQKKASVADPVDSDFQLSQCTELTDALHSDHQPSHSQISPEVTQNHDALPVLVQKKASVADPVESSLPKSDDVDHPSESVTSVPQQSPLSDSNVFPSLPAAPTVSICNSLDQLPELLHVETKVCRLVPLSLLVDSGSNVTLMTLHTALQCLAQIPSPKYRRQYQQTSPHIEYLPIPVPVSGVGGPSATRILGKCVLPVSFSNSRLDEHVIQFWIVDRLPRDALLGLDSLTMMKASIEFHPSKSLLLPKSSRNRSKSYIPLLPSSELSPIAANSNFTDEPRNVTAYTVRRTKFGKLQDSAVVTAKAAEPVPDGMYYFTERADRNRTPAAFVTPPSLVQIRNNQFLVISQKSIEFDRRNFVIPNRELLGTLMSRDSAIAQRTAAAAFVCEHLDQLSSFNSTAELHSTVKCLLTEAPDASVKLDAYVEELLTVFDKSDTENHATASEKVAKSKSKPNDEPSEELLESILRYVNPQLPTKKKAKLCTRLKQKWCAFVPKTTPAKDVKCAIPTPTGITVNEPIRSMNYIKRQAIISAIQKWLALDIIEVGASAWNQPICVTRKPHGRGWRVCLDLRELNKIIQPQKLAVPSKVDIQLDHRFHKFRYGSTADLNSAFLQVEIPEEDRHKFAFQPFRDQPKYVFKRMIWGLQSAPAVMQAHMLRLAGELTFEEILVYIDDLLFWSDDFDKHLDQISEFLQKIIDANMSLSPEKCRWGFTEIPYLGRVISKDGISPSAEFKQPIIDLTEPQTAATLNSMISAFGWFREHIPQFEELVAPLRKALSAHRTAANRNPAPSTTPAPRRYRVTQKRFKDESIKITWTLELSKAFKALKEAATSAETLAFPIYDQETPFQLYCDASDNAFFGALFQDGKPIGFFSKSDVNNEQKRYKQALKKASASERAYLQLIHSYEREAGALFLTLQHFEPFLHGIENPIIAFTDHAPLTYIQSKKDYKKFAGWVNYLTEYPNLRIEYIPGPENILADAGSRHTDPESFFASVEGQMDLELITSIPVHVLLAEAEPSESILSEWRHRLPEPGRHCICRSKDEPDPHGVIWVLCDKCNKAFHRKCVGMTLEELQDPRSSFVCPRCSVWGDFESGLTSQLPSEFRSQPVRFPLLMRRIKLLHIHDDPEVVAKRKQIAKAAQPQLQKHNPTRPVVKFNTASSAHAPYGSWFVNGRGIIYKWHNDKNRKDGGNWALWVPPTAKKLQQQCLFWAHSSEVAGHRSDAQKLLHTEFVWEGSTKDMKEFVESCISCLAAKNHPRHLWMEPDSIMELVFNPNDLVCGDFVEMAPKHGYIGVFVLCDAASRLVSLTPVKTKSSAQFLEAVKKWYYDKGRIEWLHLDNYASHQGDVFREWLWQFGVYWSFIAPHNSGGNGIVERVIRSIREQVRIKLADTLDAYKDLQSHTADWVSTLPMVESTLNNSIHSATGYAPLDLFQAVPRKFFASEPETLNHDGYLGLKTDWEPPAGTRLAIAIEKEKWRRSLIQARQNQKPPSEYPFLNPSRGLRTPDFTEGDYVAVVDKVLKVTQQNQRHLRPRCIPIEIIRDELKTKKRVVGIDAFGKEWIVAEKFIVRKLTFEEATHWIAVLRRRHELAKIALEEEAQDSSSVSESSSFYPEPFDEARNFNPGLQRPLFVQSAGNGSNDGEGNEVENPNQASGSDDEENTGGDLHAMDNQEEDSEDEEPASDQRDHQNRNQEKIPENRTRPFLSRKAKL